jgi:hypothetical protein
MWHRRLAAAAAGLTVGVVVMVGAGSPARAEEERGTWAQAGLGIGTVLANVAYMPAKLVYATLGTVTGGLTYALTGGSYETAQSVWVASLGGNYVLTPDMLTGERSVEFSGTPEPRTAGLSEEPGPTVQEQTLPPVRDGYVREGY